MEITTVLMAYNRPDHFREVLQGVRREGFTKVKVYIDGPRTENDRHQQLLIMKELSSVDWADLYIVRRKESHGLATSITMAVTDTLTHSDAVIVLEDDCVPRPGFRHYMEKMLYGYMGHQQVSSVCAFSYPCFDPDQVDEEYFGIDRFCPWGWATWSHKWRHFSPDLRELRDRIVSSNIALDAIGKDIVDYCNDPRFLDNKMDVWSLNWILSQLLMGGKSIYPKRTLIENVGFDGSGVHSTRTDVFSTFDDSHLAPIDESQLEILQEIPRNEAVQSAIIQFLERTSKMTMLLQADERE